MTDRPTVAPLLRRSWYGATVTEFVEASNDEILGQLTANSTFDVDLSQRDAWIAQIDILKSSLSGLSARLFLEFSVPRMGRRIDAVLLTDNLIFVIEFKVGETRFLAEAKEQVWDYALDLKNFHEQSHTALIVPILVATEGTKELDLNIKLDSDGVYQPMCSSAIQLRTVIDATSSQATAVSIDAVKWFSSSYRPTPTIIEAARALYGNHSVDEIARSDADAQNLHVTSRRIDEIIEDARSRGKKAICFVTGVPGAGKTLVGLNIAVSRDSDAKPDSAVFLSGNGPLVKVLCAALSKDKILRDRAEGQVTSKKDALKAAGKFIQNVHHFRDESLRDLNPPVEHVAVFDEAQRAWNRSKTEHFMLQRKRISNFTQSEPEFLISCFDRHDDWAAIVCLVGGGQEINTGEAGIEEWISAINEKFPAWSIYLSPRLTDSEYAAGNAINLVKHRQSTQFDESLHLAVSMRSFRAENVSFFVKALLDCEEAMARQALAEFQSRYPIAITRELREAKQWVRSRARGSERFGLLASSSAYRLKPHAIDVRIDINPVHWFLNERIDPRSSYYLEDAANEFDVQGLELDWTCVTWDGDLRFDGSKWGYHEFKGKKWTNVKNLQNRQYLLNAYRVLLTRARQGMVIFVPPGDPDDPTRRSEYYDETFKYLEGLGIPNA